MRLSLYVVIVGLFWTIMACILQNSEDNRFVQQDRIEYEVEEIKFNVKNAFLHGWNGYKKHAWGSDELCSLTKVLDMQTGYNWTYMGSTIIDSLSTLWLMNLTSEFQEARNWVKNDLEFDRSNSYISYFEVSIRILGGLLSAYELSKDEIFLQKAEKLGQILVQGFNNEGFPYPNYNFQTKQGKPKSALKYLTTNGPIYSKNFYILSEIGTLCLEFSALSYWTNNKTYSQAPEKILKKVLKTLPKGLKPNRIFSDFSYTPKYSASGEGDSYYEYLLKQYIHMPLHFSYLKNETIEAINDVLDKLVQQDVSGLYYVGVIKNGKLIPQMHHLACFLPGLLIKAIQKLDLKNNEHYLIMAKELAYTCFNMYEQSLSGISPEEVYVERGIKIPWFLENHYALRPEALESFYYLYTYTNDEIYREWAVKIFKSIEKWARNDVAYAQIQNVNKLPPVQTGCLPSYFFSETLKYLYLIFSDPGVLNPNIWIISTEGHPLQIKHNVTL